MLVVESEKQKPFLYSGIQSLVYFVHFSENGLTSTNPVEVSKV